MTTSSSSRTHLDDPLTLRLGHEELVIRRRYETLSIANDFCIAIWFLIGSVLFLYPSQETLAVWMFILGSFQFLIRPSIRLASHLHLQRIPPSEWQK
ncbi:YrhK family protein [Billgrantia gudaonensis]|uniref:YrhK-like protein n=1 Tax=Billgrantia gudaonensis TaxID=376427 RepID=A0A1G8R6Y5_9GAMM|nr:YrhK family protein [Halomonas gudaonensis]SDJ12737.1 YrhK-like protein [Halomonas gudaonensis]